MPSDSKPHQVPFNVAVARELTTFENEPTLEQALKWRLNEACDEIERLIEQYEELNTLHANGMFLGRPIEYWEGLQEQLEQAQITAGAEAQVANEEHARAESLLEQLGAQRSVLEKIVREADSSLEVLPPTNTDTAYFDGRREAALEALAASNPAKQPYVYSGDVNDPGPNPASVRCGDLRSFGDVGPITCQRVQGHEGEHAAWARPADPSSEKRTWDSSPASGSGAPNWTGIGATPTSNQDDAPASEPQP